MRRNGIVVKGQRIYCYTIATVSYTVKSGKRIKEQRVKFLNIEAQTNYELYKKLIDDGLAWQKPYVHEIIETCYIDD